MDCHAGDPFDIGAELFHHRLSLQIVDAHMGLRLNRVQSLRKSIIGNKSVETHGNKEKRLRWVEGHRLDVDVLLPERRLRTMIA